MTTKIHGVITGRGGKFLINRGGVRQGLKFTVSDPMANQKLGQNGAWRDRLGDTNGRDTDWVSSIG